MKLGTSRPDFMDSSCHSQLGRNVLTKRDSSQEEQDESAALLTVQIEESLFAVDRGFLGQNCEYFRALFRSGMKDSQLNMIHLQGGVTARGFLTAMAVCRGEMPAIQDPEELVEAAECAAFLQVDVLVQHLTDLLNSENCILLFHAAALYGLQSLFQSAALFIRDAFSDLHNTSEGLTEEMISYVESLSPRSFVALGTHSPSMKILQDCYRTVFYLDEKLGTWKHLTELPTEASTSMAGVAVVENRLYIVGGVRGVSKETVDLSFCYDCECNTWRVFDGPQQSRYNFTLVGHGGHLYAIGGEYDKRIMSSIEACDVSTGRWTFRQHAPRSVAGAASAVARRGIFVCFWKPPDTTDIYEYKPKEDEWVLMTTMVKPQSYGHYMVAHGDNLYVMRNGPSDDFLRCLMDCYNITTGQWTAMPGHYINSRGALFTAMVRGDSAITVNRSLTLEYQISGGKWKPQRQMMGFPKSGSLWTCLLRLPNQSPEHDAGERVEVDADEEIAEDLLEAKHSMQLL